jgi:hypothetical protein
VRRTKAAPAVKPVTWGSVILTLICASILAAGFFYAARQHFSTIDLGLKNSKLRKQIEDLESERRRLVLAREVSLSPVEIARRTNELRQKPAPVTVQQEPEIARVEEKKPTNLAVEPVPIALQAPKKPTAVERKPVEVKKVPKPRSEQATERTSSPNERPRVVETEKRVASVSTRSF